MNTSGEDTYRLNFRNAARLTAVVAVLVIIAMIYKAMHTEAVNIEIGGSVALSANRLGQIINLYTYNGGDSTLNYITFENMSYPDAVEQILSREVRNGGYEKGGKVSAEIWVEKSSVNDRYKIIERNVREAAQRASLKAQCAPMDSGIVRTAEQYGISVGKYRMICEMQKMDHSIRLDEYKDYSLDMLRKIYGLIKIGSSKDEAESSSGVSKGKMRETINRILFESSKGE